MDAFKRHRFPPVNDETNDERRIYFWTLAPELMVQPRHIKTDPAD